MSGTPPPDEPAFAAPWQAQAFAMAVKLADAGHFTWKEWTETIAAEIAAAQRRGDPDTGETYYEHWLAALERLVTAKRLADADELARRKEAWARAAAATPHGEPIVLPPDQSTRR